MNETDITSEQLIRGKINSETAKMPWKDLQRHFAAGYTLTVDLKLDLIEVAYQFQQDNAKQIELWLNEKLIEQVSNDQARQWFNDDARLWTCVVRPWVLIQPED